MGDLDKSDLTLSDLDRTPKRDLFATPIDTAVWQDICEMRPPKSGGHLSRRAMNSIISNMRMGNSLETASRAAGQIPSVVRGIIARGRAEYERLSEDELEAASDLTLGMQSHSVAGGDDDDSDYTYIPFPDEKDDPNTLPINCRFFLLTLAANAQFTVDMNSILVDHAREPDKAWISQWELQVNEPYKYNIKYRQHREDIATLGASNAIDVNFQFKGPEDVRSKKDMDEINKTLGELSEQYKDVDKDEY